MGNRARMLPYRRIFVNQERRARVQHYMRDLRYRSLAVAGSATEPRTPVSGFRTGSSFLMRFLRFAILSAALAGFVWPASTTSTLNPVRFEPNVGQTDVSVKYLGRAPQATLWFTPQAVTVSLHRKSDRAVLKMHFGGAAAHPRIEGEDRGTAVSNYLLGNDRTAWRTAVPQFAKVRFRASSTMCSSSPA